MLMLPSAFTMRTPPPPPPPPALKSFAGSPPVSVQFAVGDVSPPPPPPPPPFGTVSSPVMRRLLPRRTALPQKSLSLRVSVNTFGATSPPARNSVRVPLPPLQPAPPYPMRCWNDVFVAGVPLFGTVGNVGSVPRQCGSPCVAIVPPPPPEPPPLPL